jgi:hypothetical protein
MTAGTRLVSPGIRDSIACVTVLGLRTVGSITHLFWICSGRYYPPPPPQLGRTSHNAAFMHDSLRLLSQNKSLSVVVGSTKYRRGSRLLAPLLWLPSCPGKLLTVPLVLIMSR